MERFSEKIVVSDIDFDDLVKDLPFLSKNELTFNELKKRLYKKLQYQVALFFEFFFQSLYIKSSCSLKSSSGVL